MANGRQFSYHSSEVKGSYTFRQYRHQQEQVPVIFESENLECYNEHFMNELNQSLTKSHDSTQGPLIFTTRCFNICLLLR